MNKTQMMAVSIDTVHTHTGNLKKYIKALNINALLNIENNNIILN